MPNISWSKGNHRMRFGQLIEYNKGNSFLQKSCIKWGRKTSSRSFLCFKKALYEVKPSDLQLSVGIYRKPSTWHTKKANCVNLKAIDPRISSILIFRKGSKASFSTTFYVWFFKKMSCYILVTDLISLSDSLYLSKYWTVCVLQLCDVWPYLSNQNVFRKIQDKNLNILRTKRAIKANKNHFSSFLTGFQFPKIIWECAFYS